MASYKSLRCIHRVIAVNREITVPRRYFNISSTRLMAPVFASVPETHQKLEADLKPLLKGDGGTWELTADGKAIEVGWEFGGFNKAWAFMNAVAEEAKQNKHHPEWSNAYNRVIVRWTTHRDRETKLSGLSPLDVQLAIRTQDLAREHGAKRELDLNLSEPSSNDGSAKSQLDRLDGCSSCQPRSTSL